MAETDRHHELAALLLAGVKALQDGRPHDAVRPLSDVVSAPDLAAATDLVDIRARACSLLGQALLLAGRPDEAAPHVDLALTLLGREGDRDGLREVRELHAQVVEARHLAAQRAHADASSARLAELSVADIEARLTDPVALADALVRKANAEVDAGRSADGAAIARRALELARVHDDARVHVLAHLSLARAAPGDREAHLQRAHAVADAAGDFNLVTAVARAAEAAGVPLAVQNGPLMDPR